MEPNSQPQVIKELFFSLIVENTQCTLEFLSKRMRKNQRSRSNFQLAFYSILWKYEKNINFYNMSNYLQTKSVVLHLHRQQWFLKSVQSVKCKFFTIFNLACRHFDLYFPHLLQINSLQQHTKMFSKIIFIITMLYLSIESG